MDDHPLAGWKITMMLADSAQAAEGKLFVLGGGWTHTGPAYVPSAIAMIISVPWSEANRRHRLKLSLVTSDGEPFEITGANGVRQALELHTEFEVGRPPGLTPGSSLTVPLAINVGPLQYEPGRYEWQCTIDDAAHDDWKLPFEYRAPLKQPSTN